MSMIRVAVVNWTLLDAMEVTRGIEAMQEQLDEDFGPVWRVEAELELIPSRPGERWSGYWALVLLDERLRDENGDRGHALRALVGGSVRHTSDGHPLAWVVIDGDSEPRWTHRASHELLEMLVDPDGTGAVLRGSDEPPLEVHPKRICDPCAEPDTGYQRRGRLVTDFVHPAWFGSATLGSTDKFDQRDIIGGPFEVLPSGTSSPIVSDVAKPLFTVSSIGPFRGVWPPP